MGTEFIRLANYAGCRAEVPEVGEGDNASAVMEEDHDGTGLFGNEPFNLGFVRTLFRVDLFNGPQLRIPRGHGTVHGVLADVPINGYGLMCAEYAKLGAKVGLTRLAAVHVMATLGRSPLPTEAHWFAAAAAIEKSKARVAELINWADIHAEKNKVGQFTTIWLAKLAALIDGAAVALTAEVGEVTQASHNMVLTCTQQLLMELVNDKLQVEGLSARVNVLNQETQEILRAAKTAHGQINREGIRDPAASDFAGRFGDAYNPATFPAVTQLDQILTALTSRLDGANVDTWMVEDKQAFGAVFERLYPDRAG